jgi:hypothetical protein
LIGPRFSPAAEHRPSVALPAADGDREVSLLADDASEQLVNAVCQGGDPGDVYREAEHNYGRRQDLT